METVRGMVLEKSKPTHLPITREEIHVKLPRKRISVFRDEVMELQYRLKAVGGCEKSDFIESITYDPDTEHVKTKKYR